MQKRTACGALCELSLEQHGLRVLSALGRVSSVGGSARRQLAGEPRKLGLWEVSTLMKCYSIARWGGGGGVLSWVLP